VTGEEFVFGRTGMLKFVYYLAARLTFLSTGSTVCSQMRTKKNRGADLLRAAMDRDGLSQSDVQLQVGCADGAVSRWLTSERRPARLNALALFAAYGIPLGAWDDSASPKKGLSWTR
jgi:hypothetical protein